MLSKRHKVSVSSKISSRDAWVLSSLPKSISSGREAIEVLAPSTPRQPFDAPKKGLARSAPYIGEPMRGP